ncbi:MAG: hypothetical protein AAGD05_18255, partial [Bacteroidota bacterium]
FRIIHTQSRGVFGFDKDCAMGAQYRVAVVLPSGVTPVLSETFLFQNEGTIPIPLVGNSISNDTLYLEFDGSSPIIGGDMEVHLAFEGDCTAALGPTWFPMEFSYYCADCDCKHIWWCGELEGPTLHARIPPCPPGTVTCPIGIRTTEFTVNRTTFGYTDNTYTTPYDPNLANKKIAISCDSVEMRLMNVVGDTPITDSIGMVITYNNVDGSMSTDETFLFGEGTLRLTNGGNEFLCPVTPASMSRQTVDSTQVLTFDLDDCLTGLGITLVMGDTVEFIANFSVNPDGPFESDFLVVPNLRGYGFSMDTGTEYACDNFGDNFTIGKTQTVLNVPNSNSFPEGCQESFLQYQLITINNGFGEPENFGNEIRQAVKIDSIQFKFDRAVLDAFSIFEPEVSIPGHPVHGNGFFPVAGFDTVGDSIYVAYFDTLSAVPSLNNVQSYSFNFRIRVVPNCQSIIGSANGDNRFDFDPTIYFVDRFYASVIGDGSCVEPITT